MFLPKRSTPIDLYFGGSNAFLQSPPINREGIDSFTTAPPPAPLLNQAGIAEGIEMPKQVVRSGGRPAKSHRFPSQRRIEPVRVYSIIR